MILEQQGESLALKAAFWLQGLRDEQYPITQLGTLALSLSEQFRALAILVLLTKASGDGFYHHLIRSGRCRLSYLRRLRAKGIEGDHHQASGRFEPLFDAIASGDLGLALEIASVSPSQWYRQHEYEDDYCYAQLLHNFLGAGSRDQLAGLFAQFASALESVPSPRLAVCEALAARDEDAFETALTDLLHERSLAIAEEKRRGRLEEPLVVAERYVYIEALALLRLAELQGIRTEPDYLFCPSLARQPMRTSFPGE